MAAHAERPSPAPAIPFDTGVTQVAGVIGVFGGLLGVLYAIGGAVMWLRFDAVGIPPDQAVPLVPKADLLVIGLRVMVLPALATAGVLIALASIRRGRALEFQRLSDELAELESRGGDEERIARIEARLAELPDRPRPFGALPGPLQRPARIALLSVVALLILVVPFSVGAFAWPIALTGLIVYWLRLRRRAPIGSGKRFPVRRIALAGVLAAALISVARQTDPPTQLPSVQAFVTDVPGLSRELGLPAARTRAQQQIRLSGVLVKADGSDLAIGDPTRKRILTVPRSHVSSMIVGPPLDVRAPPESLLSRMIPGGTAWAVTPLEFWCVQLRYGWTQIFNACDGGPEVLARGFELERKTVRVRLHCPSGAPDLCRGYFALEALDVPLAVDRGGEPPRTTPLEYAVQPGATKKIDLAVGDFFSDQYKRQSDGRIHAKVRLLLALTPTLDSVVFNDDRELVGAKKDSDRDSSGHDKGGDDKRDKHNAGKDDDDSGNGPGGPAGGSEDDPGTGDGGGGNDGAGNGGTENGGADDGGAANGGADDGGAENGGADDGGSDPGADSGGAGNNEPGGGDTESTPPPISYGPAAPPSEATQPIGPAAATG